VQFLSGAHEGDYVALRPFVPTAGNERLVQGFVREFACDEPFQAEGVLVVLTDDTIGYVASVLDSSWSRDRAGSSSGGGAAAAGSSNAGGGSKAAAHPSGSSSSRAPHTAALPMPPATTRSPVAAGAAVGSAAARTPPSPAAAAANASLDPLRQWMAHAGAAVALPDVIGSPEPLQLHRRNARDAERDLQLWREFESLQKQHGEALCSTILESCNQNFAEAIELIKGQAGGLQQAAAAAAACGGDCAMAAAAAAAAGSPTRSPVSHLAGGRAAGAGTGSLGGVVPADAAAAADTAAAEVDEDFVRQLALSVGLLPNDALQLARLVPHLPADAVVRELQQHKGDVSLAADALLSGQVSAGVDNSSSRGGSAVGSPTAGAGGNSNNSSSGREGLLRPEEHAMRAFRSGKDPERVLAAHR
jgi:hypothetical protein